jgi:uncharacterized protein (TIGR03083 family)
MDTWQAIRGERASLVDALAALPDDAWERPSLCAGWSVRDIVAHQIATARMTPPKFFLKMLGSGFSFESMANKEIREVGSGRSNKDLVEEFRGVVDKRDAPPGPTTSWLGETIVHGEDIFRALGGYRDHPTENLVTVADFYKGSNLLIGAKKRIEGVTLQATDADWRHGSGPLATGPMVAIVMAMTGRKAALDDLAGDGVPLLRDRI